MSEINLDPVKVPTGEPIVLHLPERVDQEALGRAFAAAAVVYRESLRRSIESAMAEYRKALRAMTNTLVPEIRRLCTAIRVIERERAETAARCSAMHSAYRQRQLARRRRR